MNSVDASATLTEAIGAFFRGKRVVLFGRPLAHYQGRVESLRKLGVTGVFAVANGPGYGSIPHGLDGHVLLSLGETDSSAYARSTDLALRDPAPEVVAALDQFDPTGEALILVDANVATTMSAGRRVIDGRGCEWLALEDKTRVDVMWSHLDEGPYLPSRVVECDREALSRASRALDRGDGVWWTGDMREGVAVTVESSRLVRSDADIPEATAWACMHFDRVRLMTFVPGIFVGIDGFVLSDGVVVLRPCELVTFVQGSRLVWGGVSTYLEPSTRQRARMRNCARAVGWYLANQAAFRGAFSVRGLLDDSQFYPFDLITRSYVGHRLLASVLPTVPVAFFNATVMGGGAIPLPAPAVEALLLHSADARPVASLLMNVAVSQSGPAKACWLRRRPTGVSVCSKGDVSSGYVVYSQVSDGGVLVAVLGPHAVRRGERLSGLGAEVMQLADRRWALGVGELSAIGPQFPTDERR